ncbi:MAG TPA: hypothetical protein VK963_00670 [Candidatus Saccharimonadales bacterium]|nr:hypothetical protein [Candidatus Saccharimonadales bacterium]
MKKKDILYLGIAGVIFTIAGFLAFNQLAPKDGKQVSVEVIEPISSTFDSAALAELTDTSRTQDFSVTNDLKSGLGNQAPFGPF